MLILTRRVGERLMVGDDIVIKVVRVDGNQVRIGIDAPRNVRIVREEIQDKPPREPEAPAPRAYVCDNFLATARDKGTCHICLRSIDEHIAKEITS